MTFTPKKKLKIKNFHMINIYLTNHITRYNQVQRICLNFGIKVKGDNFYSRKFSIFLEEKF